MAEEGAAKYNTDRPGRGAGRPPKRRYEFSPGARAGDPETRPRNMPNGVLLKSNDPPRLAAPR